MDMSKEEFTRIVIKAIQGFAKVHPDAFDVNYTGSLAKRIAGQIRTHFVNNLEHLEEEE